MEIPSSFVPVTLFTGLLFAPDLPYESLINHIETHFKIHMQDRSIIQDFDHSTYYENEMGPDLKRCFVTFKTLVNPGTAYQYKLLAHDIENTYTKNGKRRVNIDPGILSGHNLILYSTKNFAHRVACQDGIYAELTCLFKQKAVQTLDWTYPDFYQENVQHFFLQARQHYLNQLKETS